MQRTNKEEASLLHFTAQYVPQQQRSQQWGSLKKFTVFCCRLIWIQPPSFLLSFHGRYVYRPFVPCLCVFSYLRVVAYTCASWRERSVEEVQPNETTAKSVGVSHSYISYSVGPSVDLHHNIRNYLLHLMWHWLFYFFFVLDTPLSIERSAPGCTTDWQIGPNAQLQYDLYSPLVFISHMLLLLHPQQ